MNAIIQRTLAFLVGAAVFVTFLVLMALAAWMLFHFVRWSPLAGLPWGLVRLAVAIGIVWALVFTINEGGE